MNASLCTSELPKTGNYDIGANASPYPYPYLPMRPSNPTISDH